MESDGHVGDLEVWDGSSWHFRYCELQPSRFNYFPSLEEATNGASPLLVVITRGLLVKRTAPEDIPGDKKATKYCLSLAPRVSPTVQYLRFAGEAGMKEWERILLEHEVRDSKISSNRPRKQVAPPTGPQTQCFYCTKDFGLIGRKYTCKNCLETFCDPCTRNKVRLDELGLEGHHRVCQDCFEQLTARNTSYSQQASPVGSFVRRSFLSNDSGGGFSTSTEGIRIAILKSEGTEPIPLTQKQKAGSDQKAPLLGETTKDKSACACCCVQ